MLISSMLLSLVVSKNAPKIADELISEVIRASALICVGRMCKGSDQVAIHEVVAGNEPKLTFINIAKEGGRESFLHPHEGTVLLFLRQAQGNGSKQFVILHSGGACFDVHHGRIAVAREQSMGRQYLFSNGIRFPVNLDKPKMGTITIGSMRQLISRTFRRGRRVSTARALRRREASQTAT